MLPAKGDAYNSKVKQYAEENMHYRRPQAAKEQPDDIEQGAQASRAAARTHHLPAKRRQHQSRYLETLDTKGNTNDGETKQQAADAINEGAYKSAEDEPYDIA